MRRLVYVGYNVIKDEAVETTSYEKMLKYKAKGFVFHHRMDEIPERTRTHKEWVEIYKKLANDIKKKRAAALV